MRALSSPISASDIGLTSDGPIVVHIFLAIANSVSVAFCRNIDEVADHRTFDQLGHARGGGGARTATISSFEIVTTASTSCDASVRSPTSTS